MSSGRVYLLLLTGELADANEFIAGHYPGHECVVLSKRELRDAGLAWSDQGLQKNPGRGFGVFPAVAV